VTTVVACRSPGFSAGAGRELVCSFTPSAGAYHKTTPAPRREGCAISGFGPFAANERFRVAAASGFDLKRNADWKLSVVSGPRNQFACTLRSRGLHLAANSRGAAAP
jgi:hypothetical protein